MRIAYLAIGNELLDGRVQDTNQVFTGRSLRDHLHTLQSAMVVPDDPVRIADVITLLSRDHDLLIVSGGAGPTSDDVTRASMARASGVPLVRDRDAELRLREKFARFGVEMPENNLRQVDFPAGSVIHPNRHGTADGCELLSGGCRIFSFPGVPREFEALLQQVVLPLLSRADRRRWSATLLGIGESHLARLVEELQPDSSVAVSYRASTPYVHLELTAGPASAEMDRLTTALPPMLSAWQLDHGGAAGHLVELLRTRGQRVSTAESCTGGLAASLLTDVPGASEVFDSGWVTYADDVKTRQLGVEVDLLTTEGAVSRPVVEAMAAGALNRSGADVAVALSGIAGPGGGTESKPVGTVWIAVMSRHGSGVVFRAVLRRRSRQMFKHHAAVLALMAASRVVLERAADVGSWWGVEEVHSTQQVVQRT